MIQTLLILIYSQLYNCLFDKKNVSSFLIFVKIHKDQSDLLNWKVFKFKDIF